MKKAIIVLVLVALLALTLSSCGFAAKGLAKDAADLEKKAAKLEVKTAGIREKAAGLSDRNRQIFLEELERLGISEEEWVFDGAEAVFTAAPDGEAEAPQGIIQGILGLFGSRGSGGKAATTTPVPAPTATATPSPSPAPAAMPAPAQSGNPSIAWPAANLLAELGLSGLSAPAGAAVTAVAQGTSKGTSELHIIFIGSPADDSEVHDCFTANGWTRTWEGDSGASVEYAYRKDGFEKGSYSRRYNYGNDSVISSIKRGDGDFWPGEGDFWPGDGLLAEYALSGLTAPRGATGNGWAFSARGGELEFLVSFDNVTTAYDSTADNFFTANGWTNTRKSAIGTGVLYSYSKPGFTIGSYLRTEENGKCAFSVTK